MKKLTLFMAGLMIAGAAFAHDGGKGACKGKKAKSCKEAKADGGKGCCKKGSAEKKA